MKKFLPLIVLFLVSCEDSKYSSHTNKDKVFDPETGLEDITHYYDIVIIDGCEHYFQNRRSGYGGYESVSKVDCNCVPKSKRGM